MPAYKVEKTLKKAIDSILSQSFYDFELIIVDDFSPDDSGKIAEDASKLDKRIKVIHNDKNKGVAESRNVGLLHASGVVVGFVDSDDYLAEDALLEVYKQFDDSVDAVLFSYFRIERSSTFPVQLHQCSTSMVKELLCADEIQSFAWNKYIRRERLPNNLFPRGQKFEDFYVFPDLFWNFKTVRVIQKPLYFYNCINDSSITKNMDSLSYFDLWLAFYKNEKILEKKGKDSNLLNLTKEKTFFVLTRCLCLNSVDARLCNSQKKQLNKYLLQCIKEKRIISLKRKIFTILNLFGMNAIIAYYVQNKGLVEYFKKY